MSEQLLNLKQVAARLSCSYSYIWREVKKGTLPVLRLGDGLRVSETDLQAFLAARRSKN